MAYQYSTLMVSVRVELYISSISAHHLLCHKAKLIEALGIAYLGHSAVDKSNSNTNLTCKLHPHFPLSGNVSNQYLSHKVFRLFIDRHSNQ